MATPGRPLVASLLPAARYVARLASWVYLTYLALWVVLYLTTGDRYPVMELANALALYFFAPLPALVAIALWLRRHELWVGSTFAVVVSVGLFGADLVPRTGPALASGSILTVMTYNTLGPHAIAERTLEVIRAENADVVLLQEVTPQLSAALRAELGHAYPYQVHAPRPGVSGMATISKRPLADTGDRLPLTWVGDPQVLTAEWDGRAVTLVNFHMAIPPISLGGPRPRPAQAQALVDYAQIAVARGPFIAAGDANATPLSDTYRILSGSLVDSWRQAGAGLGHTWGAAGIPRFAAWALPTWLVRIDYIWHSPDLQIHAVRTGQHDGVSDHLPVVASLSHRELWAARGRAYGSR